MPSMISIFGQMIRKNQTAAGFWTLRNGDGDFSVDCRGVSRNFAEGDYVYITGELDGYYNRARNLVVRIKPTRINPVPAAGPEAG